MIGEEVVEVVNDDETADRIAPCCSSSLDPFVELRSNWEAAATAAVFPPPAAAEGAMLLVGIVVFEVEFEVALTYLLR